MIKEDPPDNRFLECVVAAKVNYLITGDNKPKRILEYISGKRKTFSEIRSEDLTGKLVWIK
ncbi:hypothetical protein H5U35_09445 [Candidatus Aerophobetes bacterium]|nr:hypothetical protein [Candidatus Aerophobetes bacterium]